MPSKQSVSEFKTLFQSRYGITLTNDEAFEKATDLLRLYKTILEPTMKMKHDYGKKIHPQTHTQ
jgi:hypothetical protein